jgi:hypothetical protein
VLWVTTKKLRIARAATVWLVKRFIDREATFRFVEEREVGELQEREGAVGFHAAGARYAKVNERGQTAFEALVAEHCADDPALLEMAKIVHDADRGADGPEAPEAAGLRMMTVSFPDVCPDDHEIVAKSALLYDALYFTLSKRARARAAKASPPPASST